MNKLLEQVIAETEKQETMEVYFEDKRGQLVKGNQNNIFIKSVLGELSITKK